MNQGGWPTFSGENESDFDVRLKRAPADDTRFTQLLPSQLIPGEAQKGMGADAKVARPPR
jgi:hypothetical protein